MKLQIIKGELPKRKEYTKGTATTIEGMFEEQAWRGKNEVLDEIETVEVTEGELTEIINKAYELSPMVQFDSKVIAKAIISKLGQHH